MEDEIKDGDKVVYPKGQESRNIYELGGVGLLMTNPCLQL